MNVIIIGGGIGGLTLAIALQEKGVSAQVYESAPELQAVGAGIWMPPNAMQVFERLGLSADVTTAGISLERLEIQNRKGQTLQSLKLEETRKTFGHTIVSLPRAALQNLLAARLHEGTLHLGKKCVGYEGTATAIFADGTQASGDVLIAADGINSAIRKQMHPQAALRYSGLTCFRGVAEMALPKDLEHTCREVWGERRRFGFSPIAKDRVYWFAPIRSAAGRQQKPGAAKTRLETLYAAFPAPIPEILARTPSSTILRTDLYDCPNVPTWHEGNVALLGDAAHASTPNLGQGGAQAIEDAWVLADCLSRATDIPGALAEYERVRLPKARRVLQVSWQIGKLTHIRTRPLCALRDAMIRWTPEHVSLKQFEDLYRLDF